MKRLVFGVLATVAVGLLTWIGDAALKRSAQSAPAETERVTLRTIGAVIKATGVVRAAIDAEVRVGVQSPSVLRHLHVRVGDTVRKGQLIAELESRALRARCGQAAAALRSAEVNQRFESAELDRKRQLVVQQALAPRELDVAERSNELAEASAAQERASLAFAKAQFEETRIKAPISGVIAAISAREGEVVGAGLANPSFLTLIDLQRLETWAYVDETDIGRVQVGQKAAFFVDAYPDQQIDGAVVTIYPKPEIRDNVVDYVVVIGFASPNAITLRPEMTTNVRIALTTRDDAPTVTRRTVHREQGRAFVWLPAAGAPVRRYVKTGARDDAFVEILEGIAVGDLVVTTPSIATPKASE